MSHLLLEVCIICVIIFIGSATTLLEELELLDVLLLLVNNVELLAEISSRIKDHYETQVEHSRSEIHIKTL